MKNCLKRIKINTRIKSAVLFIFLCLIVLVGGSCKTNRNNQQLDTTANKKEREIKSLKDVQTSDELSDFMEREYSTVGEYKLGSIRPEDNKGVIEKWSRNDYNDPNLVAGVSGNYKNDYGSVRFSIHKFETNKDAVRMVDFFQSYMIKGADEELENTKKQVIQAGQKFDYTKKTENDTVVYEITEATGKTLFILKRRNENGSEIFTYNSDGGNITLQTKDNFAFLVSDKHSLNEDKNARGGELEDFLIQHSLIISEFIEDL